MTRGEETVEKGRNVQSHLRRKVSGIIGQLGLGIFHAIGVGVDVAGK